MVDTFIADLKDSIKEAKVNPSVKGTMVALYGMCLLFLTSFSLPSSYYGVLRLHLSFTGFYVAVFGVFHLLRLSKLLVWVPF